jgi:1,4-dihydroxy-2-naphthoate octaprenyltransferase
LQILSNFANDYGDGIKGTDNEDRVGPKGRFKVITPKENGSDYNYFFAYLAICHIIDLFCL